MTPALAAEAATVQMPLVNYAIAVGWTSLSPGEALSLRRGETGLLLAEILCDKLVDLNPGLLDRERAGEVVRRLDGVRPDLSGNAEVLAWLRGERSVHDPHETRERNVRLVDFERPGRNLFQVTTEWAYTNGRYRNRADVVLLLNGIPVAVVEAKAAHVQDAIAKGLDQIRRYHRETPELMAMPQVFEVTQLLEFRYGPTWSTDRKSLAVWKGEAGASAFEARVKGFFARERFLDLLRSWVVFYKKDDELRKIVLKEHQTRAIERLVERALDPTRTTGLIWHTQGSGKTFTMIQAAERILRHPALAAPTVVMLVDRNELESQLFANLRAYGLDAEVVETRRHLRELLARDWRGLIVSTIQKFDDAPADLCPRDNVFVLVDEAHRTTGGDLGNYLVAALPRATFLGFTGTPIDRIAYGRGTFKVFGKEDQRGYLDKYSIAESIADGTTLRLHYTLAPNDIRVPREQLEREFLDLAAAEAVADIAELNRVLDGAVQLKAFLKSDDRVAKVAAWVARHFLANVEPLGYKAFLVAVDREACALYKHALDLHLPADWSAVVYSAAHGDTEILARFHQSADTEKRVRKGFARSGAQPKILIVTEKLLTGFDAPILYCMYLDKPMRDHVLLQAIARVNRPWEDAEGVAKPAGLVIDFVGIFDNLEKALAFDSDAVSGVIENITVLEQRFASLMAAEVPPLLALCAGPADDKRVERIVNAFADAKARADFADLWKELQNLYEILSPSLFLRPYLETYGLLAELYRIVRNAWSPGPSLTRDVMRKTEALVRERVTSSGVEPTLPLVTIDEHLLQALKEKAAATPSRVINLARSVQKAATDDASTRPHLIPMAERATAILEAYDSRQLGTEEALARLAALAAELVAARAAERETGLSGLEFALYWLLAESGGVRREALALRLAGIVRSHRHYRVNPETSRELRAVLYRELVPVVPRALLVDLVARIMALDPA